MKARAELCCVQFLLVISILTTMFSWSRSYGDFEGSRRICGKHLSDTLDLVCEGRFHGMASKKADPSFDYQADQADDGGSYLFKLPKPPSPWRSYKDAINMLRHKQRERVKRQAMFGGVASECCAKPCSIDEMRGYCAD